MQNCGPGYNNVEDKIKKSVSKTKIHISKFRHSK